MLVGMFMGLMAIVKKRDAKIDKELAKLNKQPSAVS